MELFEFDSSNNSRVSGSAKNGDLAMSAGSHGTAPDLYKTPRTITHDVKRTKALLLSGLIELSAPLCPIEVEKVAHPLQFGFKRAIERGTAGRAPRLIA